jgi:acyl-CoA thioester hydrolase
VAEVHRMPVQLRFGDTDMFGHVNNAAFASYTELARLRFLEALGHPPAGLILARLALDFRRQLHFGDELELETFVTRIGTTSFSLGQRLLRGGESVCDADSVVVCFVYRLQRPVPVPEALREALTRFLRAS